MSPGGKPGFQPSLTREVLLGLSRVTPTTVSTPGQPPTQPMLPFASQHANTDDLALAELIPEHRDRPCVGLRFRPEGLPGALDRLVDILQLEAQDRGVLTLMTSNQAVVRPMKVRGRFHLTRLPGELADSSGP